MSASRIVDRVETRLLMLTPIDSRADSRRLYAEPYLASFSLILESKSSIILKLSSLVISILFTDIPQEKSMSILLESEELIPT